MDCIYLAAGIGKRLKKEIPKQFFKIGGKPILVYGLEILEKIEWIDRILVTFNEGYKDEYLKIFRDYNISKVELVQGGSTRQESVYNALQKVKTENVFIHEAARPFIYQQFIESFREYLNEDAVVPVIKIPFTVSEGDEYMTASLNRNKLRNVQLPQMFKTDVLLKAHQNAIKDNFQATDDSSLVFNYGAKVKFIEGYENNIKITTPLDIIIAEQIIRGYYL